MERGREGGREGVMCHAHCRPGALSHMIWQGQIKRQLHFLRSALSLRYKRALKSSYKKSTLTASHAA